MLLNFLYPTVCGFCGKIISKGNICTNCKKEIQYLGFGYIPFNKDFFFDELYCNYQYEGIVRKKILDYKFQHKKYLFRTFSEGMIYRFSYFRPEFDLIICVPISKERKKERGYNQSELIAKKVAIEIKIPIDTKVLVKQKKNKTQSSLNKEERTKNVKNVFKVNKSSIVKSKRILLVDDIYTTGATVNECSRVLKEAGAEKVFVYTVAKATVNSHID